MSDGGKNISWMHRFATLVTVITFLLIVMGALVSASNSTLADTGLRRAPAVRSVRAQELVDAGEVAVDLLRQRLCAAERHGSHDDLGGSFHHGRDVQGVGR